jgi:hypothetical protein
MIRGKRRKETHKELTQMFSKMERISLQSENVFIKVHHAISEKQR